MIEDTITSDIVRFTRPRLRRLVVLPLIGAMCFVAAPQAGAAGLVGPSAVHLASGGLSQGLSRILAVDDVAYLTQLGLLRGHLLVGLALARQGDLAAARSHMKHPGDELYGTLAPAFVQRGVPGFSVELDQLARLVEQGAPANEIETADRALQNAIDRAAAGAGQVGLRARMLVVTNLVRTAAEEYAVGVVDGQVVDAHEYQDSYGFVEVAWQMLDQLSPRDRAAAAAQIETIEQQLAGLHDAWPSVVAPARVTTEAALLHGAAARIEIAARSLDAAGD